MSQYVYDGQYVLNYQGTTYNPGDTIELSEDEFRTLSSSFSLTPSGSSSAPVEVPDVPEATTASAPTIPEVAIAAKDRQKP